MVKKKEPHPGYRTIHALVDIQVPEYSPAFCGMYCPYQTDTSNTAISCTLSGKKIRLKWTDEDELIRSVFCKQHEHTVKQKSCGTFIKSFLE